MMRPRQGDPWVEFLRHRAAVGASTPYVVGCIEVFADEDGVDMAYACIVSRTLSASGSVRAHTLWVGESDEYISEAVRELQAARVALTATWPAVAAAIVWDFGGYA